MGKAEFIAEELRHGIISGKYPCGSKFPSEYELALLFDINSKKYEEQEKTKRLMANMSEEDKALLNMLQQHTNEPEKQK